MSLRLLLICIALHACGVATAQDLGAGAEHAELFVTSDQCLACHTNLTTHTGEDFSFGYDWRASMMANSARDPYWHAAVRREVMDHPRAQAAIEDKCSTCHMPMARYESLLAGGSGQVFANLPSASDPAGNALALDGVSCTVCHQILDHNFGEEESFTGGFVVDTTTAAGARRIFGRHEVDAGRQRIMHSAALFVPTASDHLRRSEMCATCHTLYTHALDPDGEPLAELPEQVPYLEWLHSDFRETQSCQACHMPELTEDAPISSVLGQPRAAVPRHVFRGGNVFMLGMLARYRDELGVTALPEELDAAIDRTREFLATETARVSIASATVSDSSLEVVISVENLAGHKLPTGYPSRRAWLHVTVGDREGNVLFESGALRTDGSIEGNDNDADAFAFEPHYEHIERPDQVQIYEAIMVDVNGRVTTGLLSGARYVKDNRLLPAGFDKASAPPDVAVHGTALADPDFRAAEDRVRYRIDIGSVRGELSIAAALRFQTISYRWAENLRAYDAAETRRFVRYYESMAGDSPVTLADASHSIQVPE